jgi:hypothetical protein
MDAGRGFAEFWCRMSQSYCAVRDWLARVAVFHKFFHSRVENSDPGSQGLEMVDCIHLQIDEVLCEEPGC